MMESTNQSVTRLNLVKDIDYLVSLMLKLVDNDVTLSFELSCLANWMVQCHTETPWSLLLTNEKHKYKGIHLVSKLTSRTIQQSLDSVKHKQFRSVDRLDAERITLNELLVETIEKKLQGEVIFLSDLRYLYYSQSLFISNFISFHYCYQEPPKFIPNPKTYEEMEVFNNILLQSLLFWMTDNLSIMPLETHGPLIAYSGERPLPALKKFQRKYPAEHKYIVEGTRAMQSIDESPDIGATTTYIEIVNVLDVEAFPQIKNLI
ncbi:uncharacterized protein LOC128390505 [Panonychus citri]|uniref:uncharacterized protein LOC128390505 n=1 Tax=Panonychus citri TaxID=50023 RepID=UPI002306EAF5|nr:uncharacterized protein LOC128390505 [Panonychus citri]